MAESASEQDEVNPTFWLATRAGEMGPPYLLGFSRVGPAGKKFTFWPYNKSFIDPACSVKRAELRPNPFWRFYRPRSIKTQKKKDLADIQPSWPHSWSITHMSAHVKESAFRNLGNFRFWNPESWALESRIPPTIRIQYLESGTSSRRGIGIIQDCLGFPYMGRHRHV